MIDDPSSFLRPASVQGLERLALLLIVVGEECLDLIQQAGPKIVQILNVRMCVCMSCHGEEAVIALPIATLLLLLGFDGTDEANCQHTTDRRRLVHEYQYIQWITIVTECGRNESEVMGKKAALRQNFCQFE